MIFTVLPFFCLKVVITTSKGIDLVNQKIHVKDGKCNDVCCPNNLQDGE